MRESMWKKRGHADVALRELEKLGLDAYDALSWEIFNFVYNKSDSLNDVLHKGPSVVVVHEGERGWRLEVQASDGRAVTYRCVGVESRWRLARTRQTSRGCETACVLHKILLSAGTYAKL